MKRAGCYIVLIVTIVFSNCTNNSSKTATEPTKKADTMNNLVSIVEIPVVDFRGSVNFYEKVLSVKIDSMEMDGNTMGIIPSEENTVNLCLVKGNDYKPTTDGSVIYLNAGNDLQPMLDRVKQHGGQVIVPKTQISPVIGYFALFIDPAGNKLGLHSKN